ncbi:MAG: ATPase, T2SS/T4P/T4SS family, partial [Actinomycetota bacterium]
APHIVSLVTRGPNVEGAGAIDVAELVRASLRMRPDRIVVGEVRGAEALAMIASINTGQQGSLVTVHASSAAQVTDRIVALALQGSTSLGEAVIRTWAADAWDLRVHLDRVAGRRRVREIREG